MKLYHATTKNRVASIRQHGLLVACADKEAKIKGVWLHTAGQSAWAVVHTQKKHHVELDEVVVLEVSVPRQALRRFRRGLWVSGSDVAAARIGRAIPGQAFGESASE